MDKKQRDALALAAMQGLLAHGGLEKIPISENLAKMAYVIADAMLEESERTCPECKAVKNERNELIHHSGCEFGWPDASLPGET